MESEEIQKIRHRANTDVIRKLLIRYFIDKGFDKSFDLQVYPQILEDLTVAIPILASKIEIIPYCEDIDTALGRAKLGWNLFVLGDHRMFLGETYHNNLHDLARQIKNGVYQMSESTPTQSTRTTTPKKIITFITRVLGDHHAGYIDLSNVTSQMKPGDAYMSKQTLNAMPSQYFTRSGYGT